MNDLFQLIALEGLSHAGLLGCEHLLKFASLLGILADRRYRFEKESRLILMLGRTAADEDRQRTHEYLNQVLQSARKGRTRESLGLFFNAFHSLNLPQLRTALIQAMFDNPAPLHRGSRVDEKLLWGPGVEHAKTWRRIDVEVQT